MKRIPAGLNGLRAEIRGEENGSHLYIEERHTPHIHFFLFTGKKPITVLRKWSLGGRRLRWFTLIDREKNVYVIRQRDEMEAERAAVIPYRIAAGSFLVSDCNLGDGSWFIKPRIREEDAGREGLKLTGYFELAEALPKKLWRGRIRTNSLQVALGPRTVSALTRDIDYAAADGELPANLDLGFAHHKISVHPKSPEWNLPVTIKNRGVQDLRWTSSPQVPWLSLRPAEGIVKGREEGHVDLLLNARGLARGAHVGKVTIHASGAINARREVVVELRMLRPSDPEPPGAAIIMD